MELSQIKALVGRQAVDELVRSGMKLGLGTGSTALHVVRRLAERLAEGELRDIRAVPTSYQTEVACHEAGIGLYTLNDPAIDGHLDLTIDGADEVDPSWRLIKGGGGAMLFEKVVAQASRVYCITVDDSKLVGRLGEKCPVPVEVLPAALLPASRRLEALGGRPRLRMAQMKAGPVVTDHGGFVLDVSFPAAFDPRQVEREIMLIPGVTANGIFTRPVDHLFVGHPQGEVEHRRAG